MIDIWFDPKTKKCYAQKEFKCETCSEIIKDIIIYNVTWHKKTNIDTYCFGCFDKIKERISVVEETYTCILMEKVPDSAVPIYLQPPTLTNRKFMTVFQVGEIMKNSDAEIIDNTRLAGRKDVQGELDYNENKRLLNQRNKELESPVENVNSFFDNIKESKLILPEAEDTKRLEIDKGA